MNARGDNQPCVVSRIDQQNAAVSWTLTTDKLCLGECKPFDGAFGEPMEHWTIRGAAPLRVQIRCLKQKVLQKETLHTCCMQIGQTSP